MSHWLLAMILCFGIPGAALAQTGNGVNSGESSNSNTMTGPNIDQVNGINANGTPRAQSPGASMTVGAGNSTMIPGTAGGPTTQPQIPGLPRTGTATPTINGVPSGAQAPAP